MKKIILKITSQADCLFAVSFSAFLFSQIMPVIASAKPGVRKFSTDQRPAKEYAGI